MTLTKLSDAMISNHSFWQYKYGGYSANAALQQGANETDMLITGFGASGRNGGFNMTLFGVEPETAILDPLQACALTKGAGRARRRRDLREYQGHRHHQTERPVRSTA